MVALTTCPKCQVQLTAPVEACPVCGIVFSKWKPQSTERPSAMSTPMPASVSASRCQACATAGPTAEVHFRQNIGMLVARQHKSIRGHLCRDCASQYFWKMTLTTLAVGWLGYISIIIAPIFIVQNLVSYARAKFV